MASPGHGITHPSGMRFAAPYRMYCSRISTFTARMKSSLLISTAWLVLSGSALAAEPPRALAEAMDSQVRSNEVSAAAQKNVDALRDQTQRMLEEYRDALRQTEVLNAYNEHLRRLVESQRAEKASLERQAREIELTRRDIVPLMLRMTDTLQKFVSLDRPFLAEERAKRVTELNALMEQHGVNDAEKFRRVLEAYQVENGYGKTIGAYQGEFKVDGKEARTVDFLRVGRIGLYYQTLDGRESGVWNNAARRWEQLPADDNKAIRKGLTLAKEEKLTELLTLPVQPPETPR